MLVFLFITLSSTRVTTNAPSVEPIVVSLIDRPRRPPIPIAQITFKPKLVKIQISPPQAIPDYEIDVPTDLTPRETPMVAGSGGPRGPIEQAGGPLTITVTHYVAPIYPFMAARTGEKGEITMALLVNARGNVDEVKILRSTGSSRLDKAAVSAVRQWKFAPTQSGASSEPVWGRVSLLFAPPQHLLGVPLIVMPYAAVPPEIAAQIARNRESHLPAPLAEASVRRSLKRLIAEFPSERGHDPATDRKSAGDSLEAELGLFGPIQSVKFLGFVDHGIDRDKSDSTDQGDLSQFEKTRWEVYDVKQDRGASVWLVATTADGSIEHIEVAVR